MIRIGTSSWADPEFVRDWYPPKLPAAARLGWYAEHFDYVDFNSTFYAVPVKKVVNRWDSETPSNFEAQSTTPAAFDLDRIIRCTASRAGFIGRRQNYSVGEQIGAGILLLGFMGVVVAVGIGVAVLSDRLKAGFSCLSRKSENYALLTRLALPTLLPHGTEDTVSAQKRVRRAEAAFQSQQRRLRV